MTENVGEREIGSFNIRTRRESDEVVVLAERNWFGVMNMFLNERLSRNWTSEALIGNSKAYLFVEICME